MSAAVSLASVPIASPRIDSGDDCRTCRLRREWGRPQPTVRPAAYTLTATCPVCGPRTGGICAEHAASLRTHGATCVTCYAQGFRHVSIVTAVKSR